MNANSIKQSQLSHDELLTILDYNPSSGVFRWKVSPATCISVGAVAGTIAFWGYRIIQIKGMKFRASRLAFFYVMGEWPDADIDHKNRNRLDDRFRNLRPASRAENNRNRRCRANRFGRGVTRLASGRYVSRIGYDGRKMHIGTFATAEEAHAAYNAKVAKLHGKFRYRP